MPFFARPRAIALGSKPPLVTRIARTGVGIRTKYYHSLVGHFTVTDKSEAGVDLVLIQRTGDKIMEYVASSQLVIAQCDS